MDLLQDWAFYLYRHGPGYYRAVVGASSTFQKYAFALLDRVIQAPDLASIALLLIILLLSLKIANLLYQTVVFWVKLVLRVVLWGGLIAVGLWVYNRGVDGAMDDFWSLADHWNRQYDYYKEQEFVAKAWNEHQGRGYKPKKTGWF